MTTPADKPASGTPRREFRNIVAPQRRAGDRERERELAEAKAQLAAAQQGEQDAALLNLPEFSGFKEALAISEKIVNESAAAAPPRDNP